MRKGESYFWLGLFALGTVGFTVVQDWLRPRYGGESDFIKYLLGVAPNYFAGVALCSFFAVMIRQVNAGSKNPSSWVWLNGRAHLSGMVVSVVGLWLWEFAQVFSARGRFDLHDVWWTVLGAFTFYVIWLMLERWKQM